MSNLTLTSGALALLFLLTFPLLALAKVAPGHTENGIASYYHDRFHGRKTASGERFSQRAYTAAHKTLPLGTLVRVTKVKTGKSILVRINDRGPFKKGRIIDLSREAARDLGIIDKGLAQVKVEVVSLPLRPS